MLIVDTQAFQESVHSGDVKALLLLIRFPDHVDRTLPGRSYFDSLCNQQIKTYFAEQSYGTYRITCDVKNWQVADNTEKLYAGGQAGQLGFDRSGAFITPILDKLAEEQFPFYEYDSNDDGSVDILLAIHSGFSSTQPGGEECGNGQKDRMRNQATSISNLYTDPVWGISISSYAISSAFTRLCNFENFAGMGVMTHEWIHTFGMREAPIDTYDTSTGAFDILARPAGFYNSIAEPGSLSPFSKDNV